MAQSRIVIIDDHPLFREASSLEEGAKRLHQDPDCDLVLLDLRMPGVQGLSGLIYRYYCALALGR